MARGGEKFWGREIRPSIVVIPMVVRAFIIGSGVWMTAALIVGSTMPSRADR